MENKKSALKEWLCEQGYWDQEIHEIHTDLMTNGNDNLYYFDGYNIKILNDEEAKEELVEYLRRDIHTLDPDLLGRCIPGNVSNAGECFREIIAQHGPDASDFINAVINMDEVCEEIHAGLGRGLLATDGHEHEFRTTDGEYYYIYFM